MLAADVILPLSEEARFAVGLLRLTMLKTLVASPRSWKVNLSPKRKSRKDPKIDVAIARATQGIARRIAVGTARTDAAGNAGAVGG